MRVAACRPSLRGPWFLDAATALRVLVKITIAKTTFLRCGSLSRGSNRTAYMLHHGVGAFSNCDEDEFVKRLTEHELSWTNRTVVRVRMVRLSHRPIHGLVSYVVDGVLDGEVVDAVLGAKTKVAAAEAEAAAPVLDVDADGDWLNLSALGAPSIFGPSAGPGPSGPSAPAAAVHVHVHDDDDDHGCHGDDPLALLIGDEAAQASEILKLEDGADAW